MTQATIYYICFVPPKTGGELVNLQHVATLNQLGVRCVALLNPDAQVSDVPTGLVLPLERLAPQRRFAATDVVVIPEFYREAFSHFATQPCQRVIHTQGPFLTFRGFDSIALMNAAGLSAGISCSNFAQQLMQRMGSTLAWQVVAPFVLPFFKAAGVKKKLQVAYMPDKRPKEAPVVMALFRQLYPEFATIDWVPIVGMSRQACAEVMAQSAVFASFSYLEGLGLPPLEAMASGSLVCGFDGYGGSDYATQDNGLWVQEGDHEGFAHAVGASLKLAQAGQGACAAQIAAGLQTAASYSQARFGAELLAAWRVILGPRWSEFQSGALSA